MKKNQIKSNKKHDGKKKKLNQIKSYFFSQSIQIKSYYFFHKFQYHLVKCELIVTWKIAVVNDTYLFSFITWNFQLVVESCAYKGADKTPRCTLIYRQHTLTSTPANRVNICWKEGYMQHMLVQTSSHIHNKMYNIILLCIAGIGIIKGPFIMRNHYWHLKVVGNFPSTDHFLAFFYPIGALFMPNVILLTPSFCRKNQFVSIKFSSRDNFT